MLPDWVSARLARLVVVGLGNGIAWDWRFTHRLKVSELETIKPPIDNAQK